MSTSSAVLIAIVCIFFVILVILSVKLLKTRHGVVMDVDQSQPMDAEYINEQIYVGNLPYHANEDDLKDYFSRFGGIESVHVIRNFKTGRSKGYAFVTYATPNEANVALAAHGQDLQGRSMVVRIAKPRQD